MVFPGWKKNYSPVQENKDLISGALSADQMLFALAGFRELIAGILWVRADSFFESGNYDAILPIIRLVTFLDPHQIDVRGAIEDQLLILLGHAAHDTDDLVRACSLAEFQAAKLAVDLVLSVIAHAARVEQNRVRLFDVAGQRIALLAQRGNDQLAVEHIHLTADGLDVELAVVFGSGHRATL